MASIVSTNPLTDGPFARRLHCLTGVQILATGAYAPETVIRNEDLAPLGIDADWIVQRTGIQARRQAAPDEPTSQLAYRAARHCLERAEVAASEVDLILVATMTPDSPMPSTACHLQRLLGAPAAAMDVNAACAGFMYALITAMQFVATGASRRALVVGADVMTRVVDPQDKKTYPLFGDGAGAVLVGPGSSTQGLLSYSLGADGQGADLLYIPAGGSRQPVTCDALERREQFMRMDGRPVFKWAVRMLCDTIHELLEHSELTPADLDYVVLHQANQRIIDAAIQNTGIHPAKVVTNLDRYGNTSAASIPLVLDDVAAQQPIRPGSHILMCGFGAGLAWGSALFRW